MEYLMDQYLNEPKPTWTPWDEDEALHAMIMYDAFEPIDLFEDESDYEIPDVGLPPPSWSASQKSYQG